MCGYFSKICHYNSSNTLTETNLTDWWLTAFFTLFIASLSCLPPTRSITKCFSMRDLRNLWSNVYQRQRSIFPRWPLAVPWDYWIPFCALALSILKLLEGHVGNSMAYEVWYEYPVLAPLKNLLTALRRRFIGDRGGDDVKGMSVRGRCTSITLFWDGKYDAESFRTIINGRIWVWKISMKKSQMR